MASVNGHLFDDEQYVHVRDVTLSVDDDDTTRREKLARVILDELYEFVGLLDADGRTLEINRAALEGAGIQLGDIEGQPFWDARWWAVSKEVRDEAREMVHRAGRGEFIRCDVEVYGRAAGQETIIVDYSLTPIRDRSGRIVFLLPEGRNITDKKAAEAELARKTEELQQLLDRVRRLDDAKSNFFANVSHELRTPLSLILGPTDALIDGGTNLTDIQRRDLDVINRNAIMLLKQVNALLDLAKVDAGEMNLNYVRLDLARLVRTAAAHFDALAPQRSITYLIDTPDEIDAEVDPDKYERIVLNLLSNAFKFTPDEGWIRCRLSMSGTNRVLLTVQDSGPGIPRELRNEIFDRFHQGRSTSPHHAGGTGLGLAIVKDFVDLHGGTITVTDAPGGGALFQVELPRCAPQTTYVRVAESDDQAHRVQAAAIVPGYAPDETTAIEVDERRDLPLVLVVEDHPDMRRFIAEALRDELRVIAAADGNQALALAQSQLPDLIVTDLMMPNLGGQQLVAELRAQPLLAQIPVLILSARADDDLRLSLLASSVQDYVTKPFSAHELRARVHNLVVTKRARDALQAELATQNDDLSELTNQLISSRRALQASHDSLRHSEERWRAVYENSAAGIALLDLHGQILSVNPAFQEMLGATEEQLCGSSIMDIAFDEDRDTTLQRLSQLAELGGTEYRVERRLRRANDTTLWVNASVSLAPQTPLTPPMVVCVVEDVSEHKEARAALAKAEAELARVTRATAMGELAASIAHEVNQPLAAIVANGQACLRWLASEPKNEHEAIEAVQRIVRDASRASDVITRIRRFLGRGGIQRELVDVGDIINDVVKLVSSFAQAHEVTIRTRRALLPVLRVDRVQIEQVILNLVVNAIEAMTDIAPRLRLVTIESLRGSDGVCISITDQGGGIDDSQLDHLFEPFFTTKPEGMGMGLAISRSIAEAHGGRLWVEPDDHSGSTFVLMLPITSSDAT
ncbi:MAG: ATP-binding protein [Ilumatobacteraceae bacterium]